MTDLLKMPGGVFVLGIITTTYMPTKETHP
jgi:hypothetical protein